MTDGSGFEMTAVTDTEIVVKRKINAPSRFVFDAWTRPETVPQWMLGPPGWTMPVCNIDLRPGGHWHFIWRHSSGKDMEMRGVYREITPPERLITTESWGGDWPDTLNSLSLDERDGATQLTLTITYPSKDARDAALATGMKEGLAMTFTRLEELLASGPSRVNS